MRQSIKKRKRDHVSRKEYKTVGKKYNIFCEELLFLKSKAFQKTKIQKLRFVFMSTISQTHRSYPPQEIHREKVIISYVAHDDILQNIRQTIKAHTRRQTISIGPNFIANITSLRKNIFPIYKLQN
jgi:hypothetical protein